MREQVLNELVRPSGNIPKRIRELTGIANRTVADAETVDRVPIGPARLPCAALALV